MGKKSNKNKRQTPAQKNAAKNKNAAAEKPAAQPQIMEQAVEKRTIIQRLKDVLKRIIGIKKGQRDEFRYNLDTERPNYIFEEIDGKCRGFGLTHEEETFGRKNMPL